MCIRFLFLAQTLWNNCHCFAIHYQTHKHSDTLTQVCEIFVGMVFFIALKLAIVLDWMNQSSHVSKINHSDGYDLINLSSFRNVYRKNILFPSR